VEATDWETFDSGTCGQRVSLNAVNNGSHLRELRYSGYCSAAFESFNSGTTHLRILRWHKAFMLSICDELIPDVMQRVFKIYLIIYYTYSVFQMYFIIYPNIHMSSGISSSHTHTHMCVHIYIYPV
jgi:hypothetical protein